jgi:hypothetical protein
MATKYESVGELAGALRRAAAAHGKHEELTGQEDPSWPDWVFAAFPPVLISSLVAFQPVQLETRYHRCGEWRSIRAPSPPLYGSRGQGRPDRRSISWIAFYWPCRGNQIDIDDGFSQKPPNRR